MTPEEKTDRPRQIAARCWCDDETALKVMDPVLAEAFAKRLEVLFNGLEYAWVIIANAGGGDWTKESKDWQDAAAKFRDECWHKALEL